MTHGGGGGGGAGRTVCVCGTLMWIIELER